jgi:hypothetical protein
MCPSSAAQGQRQGELEHVRVVIRLSWSRVRGEGRVFGGAGEIELQLAVDQDRLLKTFVEASTGATGTTGCDGE